MKPLSEIPHPKGSLFSHSLRFFKNTMQFYVDVFHECGDIFAARIPGLGEWVYLCSPDLVQPLLAAPPEILDSGNIEGFSLAHLLGKGATSHLDGPAHEERRAILCPHLSAQTGLRYVDEARRIAERKVAEWPLGQPFPLVLELQRISLETLVEVLFAGAGPERLRELADRYQDFSFNGLRKPVSVHPSLQVDLGPWSPWGRVKKRQRETLATLSREVDARLAAAEADGLVPALDRARLGNGSRLSRETILAELLDLLFQGHEMTGDSMTWILSELLTHPEALARLRQELGSVVGGEEIRSSHLSQLPYLEAVVYEGLRRRPTNLFTSLRRVRQPFPLGGYLLPEGTLVAVCYPALSMREDLFPNPERFDPDRFYGKKLPPEVWSPFGAGRHACPSQDLALVVSKTVLATIVRKAELKVVQEEIRPVRNAYFYEPNKGLMVTLEKRL